MADRSYQAPLQVVECISLTTPTGKSKEELTPRSSPEGVTQQVPAQQDCVTSRCEPEQYSPGLRQVSGPKGGVAEAALMKPARESVITASFMVAGCATMSCCSEKDGRNTPCAGLSAGFTDLFPGGTCGLYTSVAVVRRSPSSSLQQYDQYIQIVTFLETTI